MRGRRTSCVSRVTLWCDRRASDRRRNRLPMPLTALMRLPIRSCITAAVLTILALATLPNAARAQFGGMGGMGGTGRRGGMGGRGRMGGERGGSARRSAPLINSVDLVLKHGTELALKDSQVVRIQAVKTRQDSSIASIKARLDSLDGRHGADSASRDPLA